jgi:hypothetical protein
MFTFHGIQKRQLPNSLWPGDTIWIWGPSSNSVTEEGKPLRYVSETSLLQTNKTLTWASTVTWEISARSRDPYAPTTHSSPKRMLPGASLVPRASSFHRIYKVLVLSNSGSAKKVSASGGKSIIKLPNGPLPQFPIAFARIRRRLTSAGYIA